MIHPLLKNTRFATLNWESLPCHLRTLISHEKSFQPFKPTSILNIINKRNSTSDPNANIVIVSNWMDFPLAIPPNLKSQLDQRGINFNQVNFVISKCDLLPSSSSSSKPYIEHFSNLLQQYIDFPVSNERISFHGFESNENEKLVNSLTVNGGEELTPTYFIGPVNSGKTSIVKSLINDFNPNGVTQNPNFGISDKLTHGQKPITKPRIWDIPNLKIIDTPGWANSSDNINEFGGIFSHVNSKGRSQIFSSVKKVKENTKTIKLSPELKSFQINKMIIITPKGRFGDKFEITLSGDLPSREITEIKSISNSEAVKLTKKDENPFISWPKWKSEIIQDSNSFDLIIESIGSIHIESTQKCNWKITTPKLVSTAVFMENKLTPIL